jgi:hypothetical protein
LYLEAGKRLSFEAPLAAANDDVAASYVADPADPVPYRHRPIQSTYGRGSQWFTWLAEDQSFVTGRKDLATFTMPALDHDVTVTGEVTADLFAATTGSDADWVVKLIDEYPSDAAAPDAGYQLMVAEGAPDPGGGAIELVPAVRPQPADVCAERHDSTEGGLQGGDDDDLWVGAVPVASGTAGGIFGREVGWPDCAVCSPPRD